MGRAHDFSHIPIIDVSELVAGGPAPRAVAERLGAACRESGFFYVVGHGVDAALQDRLRELSRQFFAQDLEKKIDALQKSLEALRRDLRPPAPTRSEKLGDVHVLSTRDVTFPVKVDPARGMSKSSEVLIRWASIVGAPVAKLALLLITMPRHAPCCLTAPRDNDVAGG